MQNNIADGTEIGASALFFYYADVEISRFLCTFAVKLFRLPSPFFSMKILHTSDWHLGHTLYSYDRGDEQQDMLNRIADIVKAELPDLLLVCGDIFHTSQPSAAAQSMLSHAILSFIEANPAMSVVITAGNHDSSSKHDIFREPWKRLNVFTFGVLDFDDPFSHILEIPNKAFVIAIPFVHERNMPDGLWQSLLDEVASRNVNNLPVVMMAHTTVAGCNVTGHDNPDNELSVGGINALSIDEMGQGFDYLALGHIHCPQTIIGSKGRIRYSGTPLPISFDECFPHSVSIVEIDAHNSQPVISEIEIPALRDVVTLPAEGYCDFDQAQQLLIEFPDDIPAYIRLNVETKDFLPANATDEARKLTLYKECRFCFINAHRPDSHSNQNLGMTVEEFRAESPIDIVSRFAASEGFEFDDDLKLLFAEAEEFVKEDTH